MKVIASLFPLPLQLHNHWGPCLGQLLPKITLWHSYHASICHLAHCAHPVGIRQMHFGCLYGFRSPRVSVVSYALYYPMLRLTYYNTHNARMRTSRQAQTHTYIHTFWKYGLLLPMSNCRGSYKLAQRAQGYTECFAFVWEHATSDPLPWDQARRSTPFFFLLYIMSQQPTLLNGPSLSETDKIALPSIYFAYFAYLTKALA